MEMVNTAQLTVGVRFWPQPDYCEDAIAPVNIKNTGLESGLDDNALVERVLSGDKGAYSELVQRHEKLVYSIVSRIAQNREDIDDAALQTFTQAYSSLRSFKGNSAFSTWLYRIAVNSAIRCAKRSSRHSTTSIDDPDSMLMDTLASPDGDDPESAIDRKEREKAIRSAVSQLPEKHRMAVILHYFTGLSCEQTAEILGCSVGTVWSRLHYACKKLKGELEWLVS